jgi:hypothetical protein
MGEGSFSYVTYIMFLNKEVGTSVLRWMAFVGVFDFRANLTR